MKDSFKKENVRIRSEMTILEIVHTYRQTQDVFEQYNDQVGQCLVCTALFEPLSAVSERFGLNLKKLLAELEAAAG